MDYIEILKAFGNEVNNFCQTKNFYYENHSCQTNGENKKIMLDFILSNEIDDSVLRFGICKDCGTCFYHRDYISKGF